MPRTKLTTKKLAQRIDLDYFKRPHPFRTALLILSVFGPLLALLWLAWAGLVRNYRVYSSGTMSAQHAVLTSQCADCHVKDARYFRAAASDQACRACHDGPIHHGNQLFTPNCASCHVEHRGRARLADTADGNCTQCHANLHATGDRTRFVREVTGFGPGHPEFAAVRAGNDPGTIKLNHAVHLKANLRGPSGTVRLDCDDCHRASTSNVQWRFGSVQPATHSSAEEYYPPSRDRGRAYMAPIAYAKHCSGCHGLQFDRRFTESVPHDKPEVVHAFVVQKFQQYISTHPAELRFVGPGLALPEKPLPGLSSILTVQQWVSQRVTESEELLWRKTCAECHALRFTAGSLLPAVAKSNIPSRWFQHAIFGHDEHRMMTCTSCHASTLTSEKTADVLLPGISICEQCHHEGTQAAESRCFECHVYHDWSKEKEVKGRLTRSDLRLATDSPTNP